MNKLSTNWEEEFEQKITNYAPKGWWFSEEDINISGLKKFIHKAQEQARVEERERIIEQIKTNEELLEYLRNPRAIGVRNELEKVLSTLTPKEEKV
jgi:hypothetical protein